MEFNGEPMRNFFRITLPLFKICIEIASLLTSQTSFAQTSIQLQHFSVPFKAGETATLVWEQDFGKPRSSLYTCKNLNQPAVTDDVCGQILKAEQHLHTSTLKIGMNENQKEFRGYQTPFPRILLGFSDKNIEVSIVPMIKIVPALKSKSKNAPASEDRRVTIKFDRQARKLTCADSENSSDILASMSEWTLSKGPEFSGLDSIKLEQDSLSFNQLSNFSYVKCRVVLFDGLFYYAIEQRAAIDSFDFTPEHSPLPLIWDRNTLLTFHIEDYLGPVTNTQNVECLETSSSAPHLSLCDFISKSGRIQIPESLQENLPATGISGYNYHSLRVRKTSSTGKFSQVELNILTPIGALVGAHEGIETVQKMASTHYLKCGETSSVKSFWFLNGKLLSFWRKNILPTSIAGISDKIDCIDESRNRHTRLIASNSLEIIGPQSIYRKQNEPKTHAYYESKTAITNPSAKWSCKTLSEELQCQVGSRLSNQSMILLELSQKSSSPLAEKSTFVELTLSFEDPLGHPQELRKKIYVYHDIKDSPAMQDVSNELSIQQTSKQKYQCVYKGNEQGEKRALYRWNLKGHPLKFITNEIVVNETMLEEATLLTCSYIENQTEKILVGTASLMIEPVTPQLVGVENPIVIPGLNEDIKYTFQVQKSGTQIDKASCYFVDTNSTRISQNLCSLKQIIKKKQVQSAYLSIQIRPFDTKQILAWLEKNHQTDRFIPSTIKLELSLSTSKWTFRKSMDATFILPNAKPLIKAAFIAPDPDGNFVCGFYAIDSDKNLLSASFLWNGNNVTHEGISQARRNEFQDDAKKFMPFYQSLKSHPGLLALATAHADSPSGRTPVIDLSKTPKTKQTCRIKVSDGTLISEAQARTLKDLPSLLQALKETAESHAASRAVLEKKHEVEDHEETQVGLKQNLNNQYPHENHTVYTHREIQILELPLTHKGMTRILSCTDFYGACKRISMAKNRIRIDDAQGLFNQFVHVVLADKNGKSFPLLIRILNSDLGEAENTPHWNCSTLAEAQSVGLSDHRLFSWYSARLNMPTHLKKIDFPNRMLDAVLALDPKEIRCFIFEQSNNEAQVGMWPSVQPVDIKQPTLLPAIKSPNSLKSERQVALLDRSVELKLLDKETVQCSASSRNEQTPHVKRIFTLLVNGNVKSAISTGDEMVEFSLKQVDGYQWLECRMSEDNSHETQSASIFSGAATGDLKVFCLMGEKNSVYFIPKTCTPLTLKNSKELEEYFENIVALSSPETEFVKFFVWNAQEGRRYSRTLSIQKAKSAEQENVSTLSIDPLFIPTLSSHPKLELAGQILQERLTSVAATSGGTAFRLKGQCNVQEASICQDFETTLAPFIGKIDWNTKQNKMPIDSIQLDLTYQTTQDGDKSQRTVPLAIFQP
jgi:hypothetical protein